MFANVAERKESRAPIETSRRQSKTSLSWSSFVSVLLHQEEHYVDFVCTDNGALNWLFKFQGERLLFKEPLKGLKGDKETGRVWGGMCVNLKCL